MKNFLLRPLILTPTIVGVVLVLSGLSLLSGQENEIYKPELLPDGQPNIQGMYCIQRPGEYDAV